MKTTTVFSKNITAYNQNSGNGTIIVNQGGQGSSKTISILQLLYLIALSKRKHITVASYALTHLKAGAMRDFDNILREEGVNVDSVKNISESIYYIGKSTIEFVGIEGNEARATGPRRDILYVNEANKRLRYEVFDLMNARTADITFMDFNPSKEFWYHDKIKPFFKHIFIKSTYLDNPYLPARERENLLAKKDNPMFANWWKVYGLGELGQLEDAILTNWKFGDFNTDLPYGYGLDFGVKHPDAMVKAAVDRINKKLYWKEELYATGQSTDVLYNSIASRSVGNKLIVADSAATRSILDFKNRGLNIIPVIKGQVVDDIKMLKEYEIIVDPESYNLEKNLNNWIWLDKKGEIPIDVDDDLIDAGRYYTRFILRPQLQKKGHRAMNMSR